jgi:membrane protein YqaA with SNARE-associated domain
VKSRQALLVLFLFLLVWMGYREWRDEAQALARSGVEQFGLPLLTICTAMAGIAPMPYSTGALVMAFTFGGAPWWQTALATTLASVVGGLIGYLAGWSLGPWRFRRLFGPRVFRAGSRIFRRFGVLATGLAVLIPVPFSSVCWLGGIYRVSLFGFLGIILVTRLARFALLAWLGTGI